MQATNNSSNEATSWIRAGFERVQQEPARWLGMSLVFIVFALVVRLIIPFALIYNFLLTLIAPMMLASALIAARSAPVPTPIDRRGWIRALSVDAWRELFQVFRREDHTFAIVITCIVMLGLVVLVTIPELLITGGSIISGIAGAGLGGPIRPAMFFNIIVAIALYTVLAMALIYMVPLALFGNRHAIPAVVESFQICVRQPKTVALFIAPFLVIDFVIMFAFSAWHWIGYLLLFTLGLVVLPAFVIGLNRSYAALFEAPARSGAPPVNRGIAS